MNTIYKLTVGGCVRYVGMTSWSPEERLLKHLEESRGIKVNHRLNWLRSLSQPPEVETLELVSPENAENRECYWIAMARAYGCRLVNGTDGGEGVNSPTAETREKIGASQRGRKKSPEAVENNRIAQTGKKLSHAHRAAIGAENRGKKKPPRSAAHRAAISAGNTGKRRSPELRAALSARLTGKKKPPRSVTHCAAHSAAMKRSWAVKRYAADQS